MLYLQNRIIDILANAKWNIFASQFLEQNSHFDDPAYNTFHCHQKDTGLSASNWISGMETHEGKKIKYKL